VSVFIEFEGEMFEKEGELEERLKEDKMLTGLLLIVGGLYVGVVGIVVGDGGFFMSTPLPLVCEESPSFEGEKMGVVWLYVGSFDRVAILKWRGNKSLTVIYLLFKLLSTVVVC